MPPHRRRSSPCSSEPQRVKPKRVERLVLLPTTNNDVRFISNQNLPPFFTLRRLIMINRFKIKIQRGKYPCSRQQKYLSLPRFKHLLRQIFKGRKGAPLIVANGWRKAKFRGGSTSDHDPDKLNFFRVSLVLYGLILAGSFRIFRAWHLARV
ncbi:hypothetical protein PM082_021476 [Marasmius tenuissimus]|nr:hypothetical protein PM082_021476 [Marasmius tenuissimus]